MPTCRASLLDPYGAAHQRPTLPWTLPAATYAFARPEGGSVMLLVDRQTPAAPRASQVLPRVVLPLPGPWRVTRRHANALFLEFASSQGRHWRVLQDTTRYLPSSRFSATRTTIGRWPSCFSFRSAITVSGARLPANRRSSSRSPSMANPWRRTGLLLGEGIPDLHAPDIIPATTCWKSTAIFHPCPKRVRP